jgi:hypothetical protein
MVRQKKLDKQLQNEGQKDPLDLQDAVDAEIGYLREIVTCYGGQAMLMKSGGTSP